MTIQTWLAQATATLESAGISTSRLDCLVLLSDSLEKDKAWLLSHPEYEIQGSEVKILNNKVAQRAKHVPLAYIRGHAEFYGREFAVNTHTLVPRPETETIIDLIKALPLRHPELVSGSMRGDIRSSEVPHGSRLGGRDDSEIVIADIGTGSGAIAITAKLEFPNAQVIATDIDQNCLETAQVNAQALGADIIPLQGDLLQPVFDLKLDTCNLILLCNLPYVPDNFHINRAATHEPHHALFGGPDGLDLYRKLFTQTANLSRPPHYILTEALPTQHKALAEIAKAAGYTLEKTDDFIQLFTLENN
ncbi:peptide chain release factor N(5)-glutamine methyltransferase [Candidatus Saccharibacteria bacterium]|nr:MAG: peptide chain release factor N(5)-glutamine methyltransferase [Candidatus Saccharibacteria bacterium]